MDKLFISFAYKYVMLTLMLADANHALEKLDGAGIHAIAMTNLTSYHVSPPRIRPGGSLETTNLFIGFGENKLQFLQFAEPNADLSLEERHNRWAKMDSSVGPSEAYQLATNWLANLSVDVPALEKAHPPKIEQQFYFPHGDTKQKVLLPRYDVRWGSEYGVPLVWVSVFGPTKSPILIRQENGGFMRRPELVKSSQIETLLSMSDKAFAESNSQQKSNLVVHSAGNTYASLSLPEIASDSAPQNGLMPLPGTIQGVKSPNRTTILPPRSSAEAQKAESPGKKPEKSLKD
ncbi:MAG: hypothetical protein JWN25_1054 [Verrucomicrobiales bacterium]|nr:hypothetical protein [Verrucomicrobiales bacterium]